MPPSNLIHKIKNKSFVKPQYWMYKLRDLNGSASSNETHLSPLQLGFTSYLCVTSLVPSTVVLVLNAFVGHRFEPFITLLSPLDLIKSLPFRFTFKLRIAGGLFGVILLFIFTTVLVQLDTDSCEI